MSRENNHTTELIVKDDFDFILESQKGDFKMKKSLKRIGALLIAMIMVIAMCVPAMAETTYTNLPDTPGYPTENDQGTVTVSGFTKGQVESVTAYQIVDAVYNEDGQEGFSGYVAVKDLLREAATHKVDKSKRIPIFDDKPVKNADGQTEYTYDDDEGNAVTVYSEDGTSFVDADGNDVTIPADKEPKVVTEFIAVYPTSSEISLLAEDSTIVNASNGVPMTASADGKTYTADLTVGEWLVLAKPATGSDTVYNPMLVSVYYVVDENGVERIAVDPISAEDNWGGKLDVEDAYIKSSRPTVTKEIVKNSREMASEEIDPETGDSIMINSKATDSADHGDDHAIGDTVDFKATSMIPSYSDEYIQSVIAVNKNKTADDSYGTQGTAIKYQITDTMEPGLTYLADKGLVVTVGEDQYDDDNNLIKAAEKYTVSGDGELPKIVTDNDDKDVFTYYHVTDDDGNVIGYQIAFDTNYIISHGGAPVTVTYSADLNEDATVNYDANENTVNLTYTLGHDPETVTGEDGKPVIATDDQGNPIVAEDEDGNPIQKTDDNGNPVYETDPDTGDPKPLLDDDGHEIPVYEKDENGEKIPMKDENGNPIYDEDGEPRYQPVYKTDDEGNPIPKEDGDGDPIPLLKRDENGNLIPVYEIDPETGEPKIDPDTNLPIQKTDEDGNPVYEPVYKTDEDGNKIPKTDPATGEPVYVLDEDGNKIPETDPTTGDPIQATDAYGNPIPKTDENGDPIPVYKTDANGDLIPVYEIDPETGEPKIDPETNLPIPKTDEDGNPVYEVEYQLDGNGDPIPMTDEEGNPIYDKYGDPVYLPEYEPEYVYKVEYEPEYEYEPEIEYVPVYEYVYETEGDEREIEDTTYHYTFEIDGDVLGETEKTDDDDDPDTPDQTEHRTHELVKLDENGSSEKNQKEVDTGDGTTETKHVSNPLAGAIFKLTRTDDFAGDPAEVYYAITDKDGLFGAAANGEKFEGNDIKGFTGLDAGTYTMEEVKAPAGYTLNKATFTITISAEYYSSDAADLTYKKGMLRSYTVSVKNDQTGDENVTTHTATYQHKLETSDNGTPDDPTDDVTVTVLDTVVSDMVSGVVAQASTLIRNTKLTNLPSTGGIGSYLFTIIGVAVMAIVAGSFFRSRSKRA